MPSQQAHERVQALYDHNHGISFQDVAPGAGPSDGEDLDAYWRPFWVTLGFDTTDARGSSRLMQLAVVHACAGASSPRAMLLALFRLLGDHKVPASGPLDHFAKLLAVTCRTDSARLGDAPGLVDHIDPQQMHPGQALLARWFIGSDLDLDQADARWEALTAAARWP